MQGESQDTNFYNDISPETSIRVQDEVMESWAKGLRFRDQYPTVIAAWVSKEFSQKKEIHQGNPRSATPFPMISLSVGSIIPDLRRRNTNNVLRLRSGVPYVGADKKEYWEMPWPLPITIHYQLDVYTKTRQDLRFLETAILARFMWSNQTFLKGCFPGYGEVLLPLNLDRVDDTSSLETGEEERELRKTVSLTMDGWIFRTPIKRKTIQSVHIAVIDAGSKTISNPDEGDLFQDQDFLDHYKDLDNYHFNSGVITSIDESPSHTPPNRVLLWASFDPTGLIGTGSQAG